MFQPRSRRLLSPAAWPASALLLALLAGLAAPWPASARSDGWAVTCIDCPKYLGDMTDRSLQLDAAGHPHIAYGGDHLYYAWHDGTTWHYETADGAPRVGGHASLALDAAGYPHVSYQDALNEDLKYAYKDASGWHAEVAHSTGDVGYHTSLALDASGHPHISHAYGMGSVWYATRDEQGWTRENAAGGMTASDTSLDLSPDGWPRIAFHNDDRDVLGYAYKDAGGWHVSDLVGADQTGSSVSLVVDGADKPHITYYHESSQGQLRYYASGISSVVDQASGVYWEYSSLSLDASGRPTVSYRDGTNGGLKVAYRDNSGWHPVLVDAGPDTGRYTSLVLDGAGYAHVTYMEAGKLKYAVRSAQGWQFQTVDHGAWLNGASLALTAGGYPVAAYQDGLPAYDLRFGYQDGTGWHLETVETEGDVGWSPSLALDSGGEPHIAHYDSTNRVVRYTYRDAQGWHGETVGSAAMAELDLVLDDLEQPHVVYSGSGGLQYAVRTGAGWQAEAVNPACAACGLPSLALDGAGQPHLAYFDFGAMAVLYAYRDGGGWHSETVETVGSIWGSPSLAVDGGGVPHVSYVNPGQYGMPPNNLRYGVRQGGTWTLEVVDADGKVPVLALDAAGGPHVAYGNRYAVRDAGGWQSQVVSGAPDAVRDLVLDANGSPFIAYSDWNHLKLAFPFVPSHAIYLPVIPRNGTLP